MTGRGERAPFQIAPDVRFSGHDDFVVVKPLRAMVAIAEQKRFLVPGIDQRRLSRRQHHRTAKARVDGRVAAHVVAVAVGVDEFCQRRTVEPLRRREQRQRHWHVPDVPGVDQDISTSSLEQYVVRRQPVADEDMQLRW